MAQEGLLIQDGPYNYTWNRNWAEFEARLLASSEHLDDLGLVRPSTDGRIEDSDATLWKCYKPKITQLVEKTFSRIAVDEQPTGRDPAVEQTIRHWACRVMQRHLFPRAYDTSGSLPLPPSIILAHFLVAVSLPSTRLLLVLTILLCRSPRPRFAVALDQTHGGDGGESRSR